MKKLLAAAAMLLGLAISGCSGGGSPNFYVGPLPTPTPGQPVQAEVNFNPAADSLSDIPFPNDLLRNPATGQNDLPCPCPTGSSSSSPSPNDAVASFNSLNGFSEAGTVQIPFLGAVDPTTVTPTTVLTLDITNNTNPVTAPMTVSLTSDGNGNSIVDLQPTVPLSPSHEYIVIVTNKVLTASDDAPLAANPIVVLTQQTSPLELNGVSQVPGLSATEAQELEPIREALQPTWAAAASITGEPVSAIPEAFTFGTQPLFTTLEALATSAQESPPTPTVPTPSATISAPPPTATPSSTPFATGSPEVFPNPITATSSPSVTQFVDNTVPTYIGSSEPPPSSSIGAIIFGSMNVPNYQTPSETATTPPGFFQYPSPAPTNEPSGLPEPEGANNNVDFIICLPAGVLPTAQGGQANPVPCVVFQHGFTRTNFDVFAIANTLCSEGEGVIAINLVLHGDRALAGEPSGTDFLDLADLRATRDNMRQSVSDQDQLIAMITGGNSDFLGKTTGNIFLTQDPQYVGESLGAILGGLTTATNSQIPTSVLNVPGGRWTTLVLNSPTFGPLLTGPTGLPAYGLQPGTPAFNDFIYILQTVVDDADPFNYAPHWGLTQPTTVNLDELRTTSSSGRDLAGNSPVSLLFQEMIGDQDVPNSAAADLALAADIGQINGQPAADPGSTYDAISTPTGASLPFSLSETTITENSTGATNSGLYQYTGGGHGFLLGPSGNDTTGILTFEAQEQVAFFLGTALENSGNGVIIVPGAPDGRVQNVDASNYIRNPDSMFFFGH